MAAWGSALAVQRGPPVAPLSFSFRAQRLVRRSDICPAVCSTVDKFSPHSRKEWLQGPRHDPGRITCHPQPPKLPIRAWFGRAERLGPK